MAGWVLFSGMNQKDRLSTHADGKTEECAFAVHEWRNRYVRLQEVKQNLIAEKGFAEKSGHTAALSWQDHYDRVKGERDQKDRGRPDRPCGEGKGQL